MDAGPEPLRQEKERNNYDSNQRADEQRQNEKNLFLAIPEKGGPLPRRRIPPIFPGGFSGLVQFFFGQFSHCGFSLRFLEDPPVCFFPAARRPFSSKALMAFTSAAPLARNSPMRSRATCSSSFSPRGSSATSTRLRSSRLRLRRTYPCASSRSINSTVL